MKNYFRLCVLDDGLWLVVRTGLLRDIRRLAEEYRQLGFDIKIKPNRKESQ